MSSPIDAAFGKLKKVPYRLSISYANGIVLADGELTLESALAFSPKGMAQVERVVRFYADDTNLDIYPRVGAGQASRTKVELVVKRTMPHYYIALLLEDGKIWYDWSADSNPSDDIFFNGSFGTLAGAVGNWGYAVLSLTLK